MNSYTIRALLTACLGLGGVCLVWRLMSETPADEVRVPPAETSPALPLPQVRTRVVSDVSPPPDDLPNWDVAGSEDRLKLLEGRFAVAVAAIEAGSPNTEQAQAALTAMRPELYGTPAGRARHRHFEQQLERALGEQPPVSEGVAQ